MYGGCFMSCRIFAFSPQNAKTRRDDIVWFCRIFVFSLFRILKAKKRKYVRLRVRIRHIKYVEYSHSICRIFYFRIVTLLHFFLDFLRCYIFGLLHFCIIAFSLYRIVTFSHLRVPVVHAHGDNNLFLLLL
jgi:hypothetical protein